MRPRDVVLLSTADWDNPFWTNKQHVAVELARRGFRVLYVESLGLRRPSTSKRDVRRLFRRLLRGLRPPREVRERLWVWSPLVLPLQGSPLVRLLNRRLLGTGLARGLARLDLRREILWTYNPLTTGFLDPEAFETSVYHVVDDIQAQPGMPVEALVRGDRDLTARVDVVFTTAPRLSEIHEPWNANTHLLPNVADFGHFRRALEEDTKPARDIAALPGPRIGFVGALSAYKVDFELIRWLAASRPGWSIVLIGQTGEGDPWTDDSPLCGLANLHVLGPRDYRDLPSCLKAFDVAILPSRRNAYTESMFPMKFFEYLAAGCPVVGVRLPALEPYAAVSYLASGREDFLRGIERALAGEVASLEERLDVARAHTYEKRTDEMIALLERTHSGRAST